MITKKEIEILEKLLINKSLDTISKVIGFEYDGTLNKSFKLDENSWNDIKNDIVKVYKKNIQKPEFNKFRKKVELKNAQLGFIVPQEKLVAKEKITPEIKTNSKVYKPKKAPTKKKVGVKTKKLSKSKIAEREMKFKKSIYLYFQEISYDKDIHKIYKSKNSFQNIKKYLKNLFSEQDNLICKKIEKSETFSSLFYSLPSNKEKSKKICKLVEFEKKTNEKRTFNKNTSIRTISIPMGGQNK